MYLLPFFKQKTSLRNLRGSHFVTTSGMKMQPEPTDRLISSNYIFVKKDKEMLLYIIDRSETNKYGCVINKKLLGAIIVLLLAIDKQSQFAMKNTH